MQTTKSYILYLPFKSKKMMKNVFNLVRPLTVKCHLYVNSEEHILISFILDQFKEIRRLTVESNGTHLFWSKYKKKIQTKLTLDESLIVSDKLIVDHNLMHLNVDNLQIIYENNLKRYDFFFVWENTFL